MESKVEDTSTFSALPQEEQQELEQTLSQNSKPVVEFVLHLLSVPMPLGCLSCLSLRLQSSSRRSVPFSVIYGAAPALMALTGMYHVMTSFSK